MLSRKSAFLYLKSYYHILWKKCAVDYSVNHGSVKLPPRKLPPMKIAPYENTHLWKFPPLKFPPLKIAPKKITPTKLTPRKLSPMKVATIVVRNWKLLPCGPYVVMKNKAWWPVWWSRVSWKYRYLFNLTWIVVFL